MFSDVLHAMQLARMETLTQALVNAAVLTTAGVSATKPICAQVQLHTWSTTKRSRNRVQAALFPRLLRSFVLSCHD